MPLMKIFGMTDEFFWKNMFYFATSAILILYVIFAIRFMRDSGRFEKGTEARAYYMGLGLFILSVAIGEWVYLWDVIFRTYTGDRLFLALDPGSLGARNDWQHWAGVRIDTVINRDYYMIIFWAMIISLSFLMKPLEHFISKREKPLFTNILRFLIPIPLLVRIFELNFYNWFGIQVLAGSLPFLIFTGLWISVIFMIIFSVTSLIGLYYKMGFRSPEKRPLKKGALIIFTAIILGVVTLFLTGSWVVGLITLVMVLLIITGIYIRTGLKSQTSYELKKKSIMIIFGIILWMLAVFLTKTVHDNIDKAWYIFPTIPLLLIFSLYFSSIGYRQESYKSGDATKDLTETFILSRPPKITKEEVKFYREQTICLVCKGKLGGYGVFLCYECKALYCENCARAIEDLENACWACNYPIAKSKPVKLPDKRVEEVTVEESSIKGIKNKKLEE